MVLYQCDKCNFETNDKGKYNRHCNRKFPCNKNDKIKSIQSDKKEITHFTQKLLNFTQNCSKFTQNCSISESKPNEVQTKKKKINTSTNPVYICIFCGKESKRKYNHERHLKICKSNKNEKNDINQKFIYIKDLEERTKFLEEKIDQIECSKSVINNVINNYNYNITLNAYGKENLEFLTDYKLRQLFSAFKDNLIHQLIKDIHCNPSLPENMNLFKPNKKETHIMVFDGDRWMLDYGPNVIKKLITDKIHLLDEWLYKVGAIADEADILEQIQDKNNDEDSDIQNKISIDLYNNKKIIEQNFSQEKLE